MATTLTIAIPVYKRLTTLARAVASVRAQTYPHIDLLISDNGQNGDAVRRIVEAHYDRPYRFHQRAETVPVVDHFNLLIAEADGDYFTLLCDDDELSPDFAEEMAGLLDRHPGATIAFPRNHVATVEGGETKFLVRDTAARPGDILPGQQFLTHWARRDYGFGYSASVTHLARTAVLREVEGYPRFERAVHSDEALLVKIALRGDVALADRGAFIWFDDAASMSHNLVPEHLTLACRQYQRFLRQDPLVNRLTARDPAAWTRTRRYVLANSTYYYWWAWNTVFRERMPVIPWIRAGYAAPFAPHYYARVTRSVLGRAARAFRRLGRQGGAETSAAPAGTTRTETE